MSNILLGAFAKHVSYSVFGSHLAAGFVKCDKVQATTWPRLLVLFRQGFAYFICLVPGTLLSTSIAFSIALSIASYLNDMNITWTYG